jgi:hypothetical protein
VPDRARTAAQRRASPVTSGMPHTDDLGLAKRLFVGSDLLRRKSADSAGLRTQLRCLVTKAGVRADASADPGPKCGTPPKARERCAPSRPRSRRIRVLEAPADLVAGRATPTGEHLADYVGA